MTKIYPESGVEIQGFVARHYDAVMNVLTLGLYRNFIQSAVAAMNIVSDDRILDLGAGTGRNALLMLQYLSPGGSVTGLEISDIMIRQFQQNCRTYPNAGILKKRIDQPLGYTDEFTKVFMSFVLHGFPQQIRRIIIENAWNALKSGGEFIVLDYNEFIVDEMPFHARIPFKAIECPYAFEYVERDWKSILENTGFGEFSEKLFLKKYIRLLKMKKL